MDRSAKLDPAVKAWLDRVLIPALVEGYVHDSQRIEQAPDGNVLPVGVELTQSENAYEPPLCGIRPLLK